jgi:tetratricopeptide (TPR) repeat protein
MLYVKGGSIGRDYEVRDVLGAGGFGIVYLVYSKEWKKLFALKTFKDEFLDDPSTRDLFKKEAKLWINIGQHPWIVQAHFVDEVDGRVFVASEFVAADETGLKSLSLDELLRAGPADLRKAFIWSLELCWGMEFAYSRGIRCHRDIKPSNVLLGKDGSVKISDFGLAGALVAQARSPQVKVCIQEGAVGLSCQTRQGVAVGTPTHMPPEQFVDASACDERSDIYSFGVMLFQIVEGRLPFFARPPRDDSEDEGMRFMSDMFRLHCDAPIPASASPLSSVIARCLQKRPEDRYQRFEDLRKDLLLVLKQKFAGTELLAGVEALSGAYDKALPQAASRDLSGEEWNNRGVSLLALGHSEEAMRCFSRAVELNPSAAEAWSNKGAALEHLSRSKEALECYKTAVGLEPNDSMHWNNMGVCFFLMGRYEEALRCLDEAVRLNAANGKAWLNMGVFLRKMRRPVEAVDCLHRALLLIPQEPRAWKNIGDTFSDLGNFEEAVASFTRALAIDPRYAEAWHGRGCALAFQRRYEEALPCFQKSLDIDPGGALLWFDKGAAEDALGDIRSAIESFRKFLSVAPDSLSSQRNHALKRLGSLENK